jgi:hypothetical protein
MVGARARGNSRLVRALASPEPTTNPASSTVGLVPFWIKRIVLGGLAIATVFVVPRVVAGQQAEEWFEGRLETQEALARSVVETVMKQPGAITYATGSERFDGQSSIAIHQMLLLGLGQIVLAHPETRAHHLPAMRTAAQRLIDPRTLAYARSVYGVHGMENLDDHHAQAGHAYLGYINLGLGMLRMVEPDMTLAAVHDRLTDALAARIAAAPHGLIDTYPHETWPPDVAAVVGSIGLHARATGRDRSEFLEEWQKRFVSCAVDRSGYLVQRVTSIASCTPTDAPRGSGTAISSYFLSFAAPEVARRLYDALVEQGSVSVLGLGGFREYAPGFTGKGDINAGPIVFGVSVGGTGFGLAPARLHRDRERFLALYRSTSLFGMPTRTDAVGTIRFAAGGVLGNALLLAMLTARPAS